MSILIGFLGKKRSGKDTCGDYLCDKYKFKKYNFAKPLKEICKIIFNFNDDQLYGDLKEVPDEKWKITPRHAFQYIGTDMFRNMFCDDVWIKIFENKYVEDVHNYCICDVRFKNEINCIHKNNGFIIKITRPNNINDSEIDMHESENIDDITEYDFEIINDGDINNLCEKLEIILNDIIKMPNTRGRWTSEQASKRADGQKKP